MSIITQVDHERHELNVIAKDAVSLEDVEAHLRQEEESHALGYRELIDASEATSMFDSDDVRTVVALLQDLGRRAALGPTAIIVSNDVTYGMCRMLEILLDDVCELRPFRMSERAEAEHWLATAAIRGPGRAS